MPRVYNRRQDSVERIEAPKIQVDYDLLARAITPIFDDVMKKNLPQVLKPLVDSAVNSRLDQISQAVSAVNSRLEQMSQAMKLIATSLGPQFATMRKFFVDSFSKILNDTTQMHKELLKESREELVLAFKQQMDKLQVHFDTNMTEVGAMLDRTKRINAEVKQSIDASNKQLKQDVIDLIKKKMTKSKSRVKSQNHTEPSQVYLDQQKDMLEIMRQLRDEFKGLKEDYLQTKQDISLGAHTLLQQKDNDRLVAMKKSVIESTNLDSVQVDENSQELLEASVKGEGSIVPAASRKRHRSMSEDTIKNGIICNSGEEEDGKVAADSTSNAHHDTQSKRRRSSTILTEFNIRDEVIQERPQIDRVVDLTVDTVLPNKTSGQNLRQGQRDKKIAGSSNTRRRKNTNTKEESAEELMMIECAAKFRQCERIAKMIVSNS